MLLSFFTYDMVSQVFNGFAVAIQTFAHDAVYSGFSDIILVSEWLTFVDIGYVYFDHGRTYGP